MMVGDCSDNTANILECRVVIVLLTISRILSGLPLRFASRRSSSSALKLNNRGPLVIGEISTIYVFREFHDQHFSISRPDHVGSYYLPAQSLGSNQSVVTENHLVLAIFGWMFSDPNRGELPSLRNAVMMSSIPESLLGNNQLDSMRETNIRHRSWKNIVRI